VRASSFVSRATPQTAGCDRCESVGHADHGLLVWRERRHLARSGFQRPPHHIVVVVRVLVPDASSVGRAVQDRPQRRLLDRRDFWASSFVLLVILPDRLCCADPNLGQRGFAFARGMLKRRFAHYNAENPPPRVQTRSHDRRAGQAVRHAWAMMGGPVVHRALSRLHRRRPSTGITMETTKLTSQGRLYLFVTLQRYTPICGSGIQP
jgi:hypothetical protein